MDLIQIHEVSKHDKLSNLHFWNTNTKRIQTEISEQNLKMLAHRDYEIFDNARHRSGMLSHNFYIDNIKYDTVLV